MRRFRNSMSIAELRDRAPKEDSAKYVVDYDASRGGFYRTEKAEPPTKAKK